MKRAFRILIFFAAGIAIIFAGCDHKTTEPGDTTPIRIIVPSNGDILMNPVTVQVRIGSGYSITDVEFYVDGDLEWIDNNSPFDYYWNIFGFANNSQHTITATGYAPDSSYTSSPVTVTISLEQGLVFVSSYRPGTGQSFGVTNYSDFMFVATGQEGVEVIDILDITAPVYLSRFESAGQALKVDAIYPYLFIADYSGGVVRADFSNPDSLVDTGEYNINVQANDVAISGDIAIVADQNGFIILDNSLPDSLPSIYTSTIFSGSNYVVARNDTAYMTNISDLYIIDASIPGSPAIVSNYSTPGTAQAVAVIDTFVFIADGAEGVISLSISEPASPRFLARYDIGQSIISAVAATDSTAFAGTFSGEIIALDYSQADTLIAIDNLVIQDVNINDLRYDPPFLFAATSDGVSIIRFIR